jgi:putative ubiquitin-RnfH superfamily antitoxin RatB of RatAB toxin-antitoxin module
MSASQISIEVVVALPGRQVLRRLWLPAGSSIVDAIRASGLLADFPKIDVSRVGIHGRLMQPVARLRDGDRVEIYRPLQGDPKDIRRKRAQRRGR